jgi:hypothetical protein
MPNQNNYSPKQIEDAFFLLELTPTLDKSKINSAWKNRATHYHPDKAYSTLKKEEYHSKFIKLLEARDICLSLVKISSSPIQNLYEENFTVNTSNTDNEVKLENEWENFVKNEKKYFSSKELIKLAIFSFFEISFHSILVSILSSLIIIICILLTLGIFSMTPELPVFVWIFSPVSLIFLVFYTSWYLNYLDTFILKKLIHIGYPFKHYIILWIIENIIFVSLLIFSSKESIFIFVIGNLGFAIQFQRIKTKIHDIEDVLKNYSNKTDLI